jgi:hypothetical protein
VRSQSRPPCGLLSAQPYDAAHLNLDLFDLSSSIAPASMAKHILRRVVALGGLTPLLAVIPWIKDSLETISAAPLFEEAS